MILQFERAIAKKSPREPSQWVVYAGYQEELRKALKDAGINATWIGWIFKFDTVDDEHMAIMMFGV